MLADFVWLPYDVAPPPKTKKNTKKQNKEQQKIKVKLKQTKIPSPCYYYSLFHVPSG